MYHRNVSSLRTAILISGSGSTAEAIIRACQDGWLEDVCPAVVIASKNEAGGIVKAQALGIKVEVVERKLFTTIESFGKKLLKLFKKYGVDLISQNGWLPLTPSEVVCEYKGRIINQHPGPLDPGRLDFGGKGMYGARVVGARLIYSQMAGSDFWTESTVHHVTNEYDKGEIIRTSRINIPAVPRAISLSKLESNLELLTKTIEEIQARLLPIEHENMIKTLSLFASRKTPIFIRRKPLIPIKNKELLIEAKKLAIKLFPKG